MSKPIRKASHPVFVLTHTFSTEEAQKAFNETMKFIDNRCFLVAVVAHKYKLSDMAVDVADKYATHIEGALTELQRHLSAYQRQLNTNSTSASVLSYPDKLEVNFSGRSHQAARYFELLQTLDLVIVVIDEKWRLQLIDDQVRMAAILHMTRVAARCFHRLRNDVVPLHREVKRLKNIAENNAPRLGKTNKHRAHTKSTELPAKPSSKTTASSNQQAA